MRDQIRKGLAIQESVVGERQWFDITGDVSDDKPKSFSPAKKVGEKSPSCWGCGHDYLNRWSKHDLVPKWKHADTKKTISHPICPDCHGEAAVHE